MITLGAMKFVVVLGVVEPVMVSPQAAELVVVLGSVELVVVLKTEEPIIVSSPRAAGGARGGARVSETRCSARD